MLTGDSGDADTLGIMVVARPGFTCIQKLMSFYLYLYNSIICISVCLPAYLSVCLFGCLSVCLSVYPYFYLSIFYIYNIYLCTFECLTASSVISLSVQN